MTAVAVNVDIHVRVGNEDNIWRMRGERFTTLQQIEQMVRLSKAYGHKVATTKEAHRFGVPSVGQPTLYASAAELTTTRAEDG